MDSSQLVHTLTGREYSSDDVFAIERQRIFHRSWFYVCRDERLAAGDRFVADVAGESVLLVKDRDGQVHAHANVCRHRGARLCDESGPGSKGGITCPYHAWTYSLDGRLIGTPHLAADEVDRASLSLWSVACEVWHGFVFVNLSADPTPLRDSFAPVSTPSQLFEHLQLGELRIAVTTSTDVGRQLEDPRRELPGVPPLLVGAPRAGRHRPAVQDRLGRRPGPTRRWRQRAGQQLQPVPGSRICRSCRTCPSTRPSRTTAPRSSRTCSSTSPAPSVIVSSLWPKGAGETTVVMEYLFAADTIADARVRSDRDRRVQRAGRQAGLRRVRACSARCVVALLRSRRARAAGSSDRRFPRDIPIAHDRLT